MSEPRDSTIPPRWARCARGALVAAAWALVAGASPARAQDEPRRDVVVREHGFVAPGRLRVFAKVSEKEGDAFYPITTLGRDAFSLETESGPGPSRRLPLSLTQVRGLSPPPRRAILIALDDAGLNEVAEGEARKVVAELLPKIDASHIAIYTKGKAGLGLLVESTPEAADNIASLQKALTVGGEPVERFGDLPLFCAMQKKINAWVGGAGDALGDHQTIVYFGRLDKEIFNNLLANVSCVKDLLAMKTTLYAFDVRRGGKDGLPSLREMFQRSGGYVERVSDPEALFRAFDGMVRQINEEYAIDFPFEPDQAPATTLRLRVGYHGHVFTSPVFGFFGAQAAPQPGKAPAPAAAPPARPAPSAQRWANVAYYGLLGMFSLIALTALALFLRHLGGQSACGFCHHAVQSNHADCPLKTRVAGLVVIRGLDVGTVYPLAEGGNTLGTHRANSLRFAKATGLKPRHGTLTLKNNKALYQSSQEGQDAVNGWPVKEDRLLADGQVLQLGQLLLRFETFRKA